MRYTGLLRGRSEDGAALIEAIGGVEQRIYPPWRQSDTTGDDCFTSADAWDDLLMFLDGGVPDTGLLVYLQTEYDGSHSGVHILTAEDWEDMMASFAQQDAVDDIPESWKVAAQATWGAVTT